MTRNLRLTFYLTLLLLLGARRAVAQEGNMVAYIATQEIYEMAEEGNYLWLATMGGLIKFDKTTGVLVECYNTYNSPLPSNRLYCIAIDKQGNKWIGCDNGIIRFSGNSWEHYLISETGLFQSNITSVAVDTSGNIWAANFWGVIFNDGTGWELLDASGTGVSLSGIEDIVPDKLGNVWFAKGQYNLPKFDGQQWTNYSISHLTLGTSAKPALEVDDDGNLWVMDEEKLHKYDGNEWVTYITEENSGLSMYYNIDCGPGNLVWCFYDNDKVEVFDGSGWTDYYFEDLPLVNDILASDNGVTWLGSESGLFKIENGLWTRFNISEVTFTNNILHDIEIDREGKKWIVDGGLNSFDGTWKSHPPYYQLLLEKAKCDLDGNLWLGARDGIFILDSSGTYMETEMSGYPVNDITMSPEGNMCFAAGFIGIGAALILFEDSLWTVYSSENAPVFGDKECALYDEDGTLWFSDDWYIHSFDGLNWTTYSTYNSDIPFNYAICMAFREDGIKYFGSAGSGLARFDGINWTHIDTSNSPLTDDFISCLKFDQEGNLWIGTQKGGIFYTNGQDWWSLNMANSSLPSNKIVDIEMEGNVKWIATWAGLVSYDGTGELLSRREPAEIERVNIYPNPASEIIRVDLPSSVLYDISVINLQGKIIQCYKTSSATLNIRSLAPGFYCLRITSETGSYVGKFIKK